MAGRLRVASIGAGYFSQFHLEGWQNIAEVEFAALCDRDGAGAQALAQRFEIPRVFAEAGAMLDAVAPDIVDIVTPPDTHHALVTLAVGRGIPVICQKPLAPSYREAAALAEAAERAGVPLIVHENFRFMPCTMGEMWLEGSNGVLRLDGDGGLWWKGQGQAECEHAYPRGTDTFGGGACEALQRHAARHLIAGAPVENCARDYLENLRVQEAVYRSHAEGRRVALAGFDPA